MKRVMSMNNNISPVEVKYSNPDHNESILKNKDQQIEHLNKELNLLNLEADGYKNDYEFEKKSRLLLADEKVDLIKQLRKLQEMNLKLMNNQNNLEDELSKVNNKLTIKKDQLEKQSEELSKLNNTIKRKISESELFTSLIEEHKHEYQFEKQSRINIAAEKSELIQQLRNLQRMNLNLKMKNNDIHSI